MFVTGELYGRRSCLLLKFLFLKAVKWWCLVYTCFWRRAKRYALEQMLSICCFLWACCSVIRHIPPSHSLRDGRYELHTTLAAWLYLVLTVVSEVLHEVLKLPFWLIIWIMSNFRVFFLKSQHFGNWSYFIGWHVKVRDSTLLDCSNSVKTLE
jgi:hypothetical protein